MRTITEFFGMSLKTAAEKMPALKDEATKSAEEAMKAEGKSAEEIAAGLEAAAKVAFDAKVGETFKLEGDKLAMFTAALDVMKDARGTVKRIVVQAKAKDDEKPPAGAKEIDGKFYVVEGFVEAKREEPRDERGGKFGDKRGGKGGRGKGGPGGDRGGKPRGPGGEGRGRPEGAPRGEPGMSGFGRPPRDAGAPGFQTVTGESGRAPRAPRAPVEPYKGPNRIGGKPSGSGESAPKTDTGSDSAT